MSKSITPSIWYRCLARRSWRRVLRSCSVTFIFSGHHKIHFPSKIGVCHAINQDIPRMRNCAKQSRYSNHYLKLRVVISLFLLFFNKQCFFQCLKIPIICFMTYIIPKWPIKYATLVLCFCHWWNNAFFIMNFKKVQKYSQRVSNKEQCSNSKESLHLANFNLVITLILIMAPYNLIDL